MKTGLKSLLLAAACAAVAAVPASAETYPFEGTWNCEVAVFTFTPTTYNNGTEDLPIKEVQEGSDNSYTLMFADDYTITLSGVTKDEMGWFSPASGDNFNCKREK